MDSLNAALPTRRGFLASAMGVGLVLAGGAGMPAAARADEVTWDEERDFVVVGGGCGAFGAMVAAAGGLNTLLIEKSNNYGGTTAHSGNGMWVPNNDYMAAFLESMGGGSDYFTTPDDENTLQDAIDYALSCNVYGEVDPDLVADYVNNVNTVARYISQNFDFDYSTIAMTDYYMLEGAKYGRAVGFAKDGMSTGGETFQTIIQPACEKAGVEVMLETEVTNLVQDENGAVVGVEAVDADGNVLHVKANKGVLLNTGGFEHNDKMRSTYLRGPILGANSVPTNTGDGQRMAVAVGADLGNMSSMWGVPFYQAVEGGELYQQLCDWMTWRYGDHSVIVNKNGRRFCDETMAYAPINETFYGYDAKNYGLSNLTGFHIGDQSFVGIYGYPGVSASDSVATTGAATEGVPEWVKIYDTLEELAEDNGIDVDGLLAEIDRWNGFCDAGVDEDFGRDKNRWTDTPFYLHETEGSHLGKIESAPFFCAKIGPGTCGTCGGIRVNADAQALDVNGEPISGLYASGNCSASYFGSAYPGPGSTVGGGVYRAVRAANHAAGLGIV